MFLWAARVPFSSYQLVAKWDSLGDLARPSDDERYARADDVAVPVTEERYRIGGFDESEAVEDVFFTFVKRDGAWLIASDDDFADVGLQSTRHLWDFGPVATSRSSHFLMLRHPCGSSIGCVALGEGLLALAERGLEQVESYWSAPWSKKVVLLVPTTTRELRMILQATLDLDNFVAFASSTVDTEEGFDFGGHRILLNPSAFLGRTESSALTILAHELLHVATRTVSGPFVPTVVEEGIAEYIGYDADPGALAFFESQVEEGRFVGSLPQDYEFVTGSATDVYTSYQEAHSAVAFFVQRWGMDKLVGFYRRLGEPAIVAGTARYHVSRALRATIGIGEERFEALWADSIRS